MVTNIVYMHNSLCMSLWVMLFCSKTESFLLEVSGEVV